ncbi:2-hydroxyacid dehydrogenase [Rhodoferax ferrireducens]|uniref:2-hydroxyacid dehydrogenase n=1 Tax=Rhodoferax ferrireducens TaxID=192843 RepID=UPI000E0D165B|nr:2-hydroxyacid dehydrogenase [Rhodoferax ferrireducens]
MSKPDILAVAKLHPFYLEALQASFTVHDRAHEADAAAFAELAPRISGIAAMGESRVSRSLLAQLPNLKVVSVFGVGYDGVDTEAARERGICVTHTPDVLSDDVADLAIGLMLSIARRIPQADQHVRAGRWPSGPMPLGRKVTGARLGIVGLGRIGKAIARRAQAFDMSIAYTARSEKPESGYLHYPNPKALAAEVDFLVVITPGGAGTRHLINAEVLSALGPNGFLINVARGSVVDESALVHALQSGLIAGAALDVFENEPNVPAELWSLGNVVLTPHMASATQQTRQAMADLAFANMRAGLAGEPLLTPVPECR